MKHLIRNGIATLVALGLLGGCGERPPIDTQQLGYRGTGMEENINPRIMKTVMAANQPGPIQPSADGSGPLASEVYQNVQVLKDLSVGEFTRVMLSMVDWVAPADQKDCTYCHNAENYADESKYQYQVARRMLTMTRDINSNWQAHVGQTGVTCHTCHRGQPVPPYVWFVDPGSGRENAFVGTRAGQNSAVTGLGITTIGHSSLPYDPYSPYLLGNLPIRVVYPQHRLGPTGDVAKVNCQTCHQGVNKPYGGVSMAKDYPELQREKPLPVMPVEAAADAATTTADAAAEVAETAAPMASSTAAGVGAATG
jgi:photosynthetic reaction center cytochrome c subunit